MDMNATLTASNIKYLLVIHRLNRNGHGTRCTDIAQYLHVSKPSVHRIATLLKEKKLIQKDHYGVISFTKQGFMLSSRYVECFEMLHAHLKGLLPKSADAKGATCAMLSELTLEEIECMCNNLRTHSVL